MLHRRRGERREGTGEGKREGKRQKAGDRHETSDGQNTAKHGGNSSRTQSYKKHSRDTNKYGDRSTPMYDIYILTVKAMKSNCTQDLDGDERRL